MPPDIRFQGNHATSQQLGATFDKEEEHIFSGHFLGMASSVHSVPEVRRSKKKLHNRLAPVDQMAF